jgi:rod shape-determining protein MreD
MIIKYLISISLLSTAVILQSTLIRFVAISGVIPDLSLIILIYVANKNGRMIGQVDGFAAGLVEDIISISPLGFHSLLRTLIGFFYGLTKGVVFLDPILMPVVLVIVGTLLKGLLAGLIGLLFSVSTVFPALFSGGFFIEMGYNAFIAPFLFGLLSLIKPLKPRPGREEL